jgi:Lon protease-like protein
MSVDSRVEEEISLFPIPGSVSLPFTHVPLHIFEPRYRKMIHESVDQKRRIGVAHTIRTLKASTVQFWTSEEDRLNLDHETYEAYPIFSAGFARIHQTLLDGRIIVEIEMDRRYEVKEVLKELPYQVVRCTPYDDMRDIDAESNALRDVLEAKLESIAGEGADLLKEKIKSVLWKSQTTEQYSFAIFSLIQLPPDRMQKILEMRSAYTRMEFFNGMIR